MPLFGTRKKETVNATPKDSISKLRETLDLLDKREQFLQKKIQDELNKARELNDKKNKRGALICLKKKHVYETQAEKLSGTKMALEQQVMTLEGANVSVEAMKALKAGAASMKSIHKELDVDKINDVMDDVNEQMDLAREIQDAISTPLAGGDVVDEDELLRELDTMEQESLDEQLLQKIQIPSSTILSKKHAEVKKEPDEEAELAALEASMA